MYKYDHVIDLMKENHDLFVYLNRYKEMSEADFSAILLNLYQLNWNLNAIKECEKYDLPSNFDKR